MIDVTVGASKLKSIYERLPPVTCFVYVIGSSGQGLARTYVGWTTNLGQRLAAHNAGTGARSTRGRDWVMLYAEAYQTRGEAMSREWHLKRDKKFRKMLSAGA
ncbi:MAG: GIY-YIG nuclease family protein [Rhodospirillaceae bacterium]|nr:GIY-YIG nuclease family protein [Rhodospirillaceae bacterium]